MSTNTQIKELPYHVYVASDNVVEVTPNRFPNITREQIEDKSVEQFHMGHCKRIYGIRGGVKDVIVTFIRNGKLKTWKTRPTHFHLPIHRGMYNKQSLNHENVGHFHLASECPLIDVPSTREGIMVEVTDMLEDTTQRLKQKVWDTLVEKVEVENSEGREAPLDHDARIRVDTPARQLAADILGIFDDFLDEKGVEIPSNERDDIENPAAIVGEDYFKLEDTLTELLEGKAVKVHSKPTLELDPEHNRAIVDGMYEIPIKDVPTVFPSDTYGFTCEECKEVQPADVTPCYIKPEKPLCGNCYDKGMDEINNLNKVCGICGVTGCKSKHPELAPTPTKVLPNDGYADGGEPYTEEELAVINAEPTKPDPDETEKWRVDVQANNEPNWTANGVDFDSAFKAICYARDLYQRWTKMNAWRVVPIDTPRGELVLDDHKDKVVIKGQVIE